MEHGLDESQAIALTEMVNDAAFPEAYFNLDWDPEAIGKMLQKLAQSVPEPLQKQAAIIITNDKNMIRFGGYYNYIRSLGYLKSNVPWLSGTTEVYTFEDWLFSDILREDIFSPITHYHPNETMPVIDCTIIDEKEYKKIDAARKEMAKRFVETWLEGMKTQFHERYAKALEPDLMIKSEIQHIEDIKQDKKRPRAKFISERGEIIRPIFGPNNPSKYGPKRASFGEIYNRIIIDTGHLGDLSQYVKRQHIIENNPVSEIPSEILAMALYEYEKYIRGLLEGKREEETPFEKLFVDKPAMEKALKAAREAGLIDSNNNWIYSKSNHYMAIAAFWQFATEKGLRRGNPGVGSSCQIIASFWGINVGKNAPEPDSEILINLRKSMK